MTGGFLARSSICAILTSVACSAQAKGGPSQPQPKTAPKKSASKATATVAPPTSEKLFAVIFANLRTTINSGADSSADDQTTVARFLEQTLAFLAADGDQRKAGRKKGEKEDVGELFSETECDRIEPSGVAGFADSVAEGGLFPRSLAPEVRKAKEGFWECRVSWGVGGEAAWHREIRFLLSLRPKTLLDPKAMAYHYSP